MNKTNVDKLNEWNHELLQHYILNDVILVIYLILGITGNVLVIYVYNFRMRTKKDDRYFIPYLAFIDLLACIFRSALELYMNFNPVRFRGRFLCKASWFPTNVTAIASIFMLVAIALQRYLKVCRPFGPQMTLGWKRICLVMCFVVAISVSAPLIVYNDEIKVFNPDTNVTGFVCDTNVEKHKGDGFIAFIAFTSISSFLLMVSLAVLNICIGRTIYRQFKARHKRKSANLINSNRYQVGAVVQSSLILSEQNMDQEISISETETSYHQRNVLNAQPNNTQRTNSSSESDSTPRRKMSFSHRYSIMFMAIGVAFIISYLPRLILLFLTLNDPRFFGKISQSELTLLSIIREMNVINNIVNPYIYGFFDHAFRKESKKIFCNEH